jgi:hypothetical protein
MYAKSPGAGPGPASLSGWNVGTNQAVAVRYFLILLFDHRSSFVIIAIAFMAIVVDRPQEVSEGEVGHARPVPPRYLVR